MDDLNDMEAIIGNYIVKEALQGDATGFDYDLDLVAIAAIDSVSMMDLILFLEQTFKVAVGPLEMHPSNLRTVKAIAEMVRRLRVREGRLGPQTAR